MVTIHYRQMSPGERDRLQRMIPEVPERGCWDWFVGVVLYLLGGPLAGMMLAFVLLSAWFTRPDEARILLLAGAGIGLVLGARGLINTGSEVREASRKYRPDIRNGVVEVTRYEVQRAVGIEDEEYPEFITGYFLDVGEGLVAYLTRHDLEDELLPAQVIYVVRAPRSRCRLGVSSSGEAVPPFEEAQ